MRILSRVLALGAGAWLAAPASAFTVFACEPEWAALTRVLVPDATLHVATHAAQDPHHIEARPALIAQMRKADLVVCTGAALEVGWLPMLQQRSGNAKAQDVFFAASHVPLVDAKPGAVAGPWSGDVHAEGNPHVHADPHRLLKVANALAQRLQRERPSQREAIEARRASFEAQWSAQVSDWERRAAGLRGKTVAAQHTGFGYVWQWLGLRQVADLEPQPGMAPTPGHLQRLLGALKAQPPLAIVVSSYQDPRSGRWVAAQLGGRVPLLVLPATVADDAGADELVAWMDGLVAALLQAGAP
ncbi:metal ABC transporter substrate-binding protein [Piscinibacter sp.]|uniref:metal ABC transporter substrate-binding protein n=1 Tax=Piscinibacter sp. TaxID=1903157 RepID=UPI0039E571CB